MTTEESAAIGRAPGRLPLLGNSWQFLLRPLDFLKEQRGLGAIVEIQLGLRRAFIVNDPELVHQMLTGRRADFVKDGPLLDAIRLVGGDGLFNADGDLHRRQRRLMQPAFHTSRFPTYAAIIGEAAATIADGWHDGQSVPVDTAMYELSAKVMGGCLFSGRLASEAVDEIIHSLPIALRGMGRRAVRTSRLAQVRASVSVTPSPSPKP